MRSSEPVIDPPSPRLKFSSCARPVFGNTSVVTAKALAMPIAKPPHRASLRSRGILNAMRFS